MSINSNIKNKNEISCNIKGFSELSKHFDIVEIDETNKKYNILICKDINLRVNTNIDYVVYLHLKVQKHYEGRTQFYSSKDGIGHLEYCIEKLLPWVSLLKEEKENKVIQVDLFNFNEVQSEEIVLEEEPQSPKGGDDKGWGTYHRKLEKIRKNNMKKQFTFLELFNFISSWTYLDYDYRDLLPTNKEFEQMVISQINKYKNNQGRHSDGWFEDERNYITRDGALSDYELYLRVMHSIRIMILPYTRFGSIETCIDYSFHKFEERTSYRFWTNGCKLHNGSIFDEDKEELKNYDLFNPGFVEYLRETFKVPYVDYETDEVQIEKSLTTFMNDMFGSINFDWKKEISEHKTFKSFRTEIYIKIKEANNNGGSSGSSVDGFSVSIDRDKKGSVEITQERKIREVLGRDIEEVDFYDNVLVARLEGDEIYKEVFNLFNTQPQQNTLLDFL